MNPARTKSGSPLGSDSAEVCAATAPPGSRALRLLALCVLVCGTILVGARGAAQSPEIAAARTKVGQAPRVQAAQRFLARRGLRPGQRPALRQTDAVVPLASSQTTEPPTWTALGPAAVQTPQYGLVTGRISALALDPADLTGNHLYVGTTGGGVWVAQNAAVSTTAQIVFSPLTDSLSAFGTVTDASISIGALTVQPGGTGVILAGTGDPNDALDSYYGAGILRSTDGGSTWSLIPRTVDQESGLSSQDYSFAGEGFAGFAWSTANPQVVVAAVSQALEGALTNALGSSSYEGLYYSTDSGASWHLATITDTPGNDVQGPLDHFVRPDGNAATAVVWNPVRKLFVAAVRYHGYYQSSDGVIWTRITAQPGSTNPTQILTLNQCPTYPVNNTCPIFRGALAVNPATGDTFAWTVDLNDQDQGLWQDQCSQSCGSSTIQTIAFTRQRNTAPLEANTIEGSATIPEGVYNLALAAVPSQQDTLLFVGDHDLWKCSLAMGCVWRNTTNSTSCMSAHVGMFQHAAVWPDLAWAQASTMQQQTLAQEIFIGNDSGLWRSLDAVGETGPVCSAGDASHFQNLNGQLQNPDGNPGSLAEIESLPEFVSSPYTMLAGLGANGAAGINSSSTVTDWPQFLSGFGGPVAIDPQDANWYVNDQNGVAIYRCSQPSGCTPADFGDSPVVADADVGGDGSTMLENPGPFLVDPADSSKLLVGTCRLWRGPASGGWSAGNAVSPILDSISSPGPCSGNALIRSIAALPLAGSREVVYLGMYGSADGGARIPGHVLTATLDLSGNTKPTWTDLTWNPVANDSAAFNAYGFDISSVTIDAHDATGKTVYATVEGAFEPMEIVQSVYRSTDGGATWNSIEANLPHAPANALAVDPQDANTVYVATDQGVFYTTEIATCSQPLSNCWSAFGTGLPEAPVVALSISPGSVQPQVLVAGTYGRGIWQTGLWTAGKNLAAAAASPSSLTFSSQVVGSAATQQTVTLVNTGAAAFTVSSFAMNPNSGDFIPTGSCFSQSVPAGGTCVINVKFVPQEVGPRTALMTIYANVYSGQLSVDLNGTGLPGGAINLTPGSLTFGSVEVNTTSAQLPVMATNGGTMSVSISGVSATGPFNVASNTCGSSLAAGATGNSCQIEVKFAPTQAGPATGTLSMTDSAGTQYVQLSGTGAAPPTDNLSPTSLTFPDTASGQDSAAQSVTISNSGDLPLHVTSISASADFQQSSNCAGGVAAHSQCPISVQFTPTQTGSLTGTLTIIDELGTRTVPLSGNGLPPAGISVVPASLSFSQQQPGVPSAPQTVTITNTGTASMANIGFQITGPAAANYSYSSSTCGASLNSGASCTVQIAFTPSATGPIAATLVISSSTIGVTPATVPLNGAGQLASGIQTNPGQLPFSTVVAVGQSSGTQSVTVTNSSKYDIASMAVAATGPFSLAQNTCTGTLAAGATCTAGVVFQPTAYGAASGTLTVSSAVVTAPATVSLSGTGFDFTVTVSGSSSQTASSGQQADYKLVITPNGAQGTFTFQCGTLPSNALCLFSPSTETLPDGVQGNVEVEIYTGSSGLSASAQRTDGSRGWLLACGLLLLPLALRRGRKIFLLVTLAAILTGGLSSCTGAIGGTGGGGGGSGGQGGGQSTPPGTYSVPVTVSANNLSRSVTLTLTVD